VARYSAGIDGITAAAFDEALAAAPDVPATAMALVALGGYGRRELAPWSDLDLLVLYDDAPGAADGPPAAVAAVAEPLLYLLWDLGLEVGQAVRGRREAVDLTSHDHTIRTTMLDARRVAGDAALVDDVLAAVRGQWGHAEVLAAFVEAKLKEATERRQRFGDSLYYLEPNVKNGVGGLRDLQTALWVAQARFGTADLDALKARGVCSAPEAAELQAARDFLHAVRVELHTRAGRRSDSLTFDDQEAIAARLGFRNRATEKAVEAFMRAYYRHTKSVMVHGGHLIERALQTPRAGGGAGDGAAVEARLDAQFVRVGGAVTANDAGLFERAPHAMVRAFAVAARAGRPIGTWTKDLILAGQARLGRALRRDPETMRAFLDVLTSADVGDEALDQMHDLGVLAQVLPEFGTVHCQRQHDVYHVYTVDIHSLKAMRLARTLLRGDQAPFQPRIHKVSERIGRPHVFLLGVLLHDIGKGKGGHHSEKGARLARRVCRRLGLAPRDVADVAWLVRWHLEMSRLAQRRDLEDQGLVRRFARLCRTPERLAMLYCLTWADMSTTGPQVWTTWKAELLWQLHGKTQALLSSLGGLAAGEELPMDEVRRASAAALMRSLEERVVPITAEEAQHFVASLPDRYFRATSGRHHRRHFRLLRALRERGRTFEIHVVGYPTKGYTKLTLACADREGLLAMLTGALTANGLDIVSAEIFSTRDGVALDIFRVRDSERRTIADPAVRARFSRDIEALLAGRQDVAALVAKRRADQGTPFRRPAPAVEPRVLFEEGTSRDATVVDVFAQDRIGLLYDVTAALHALGLDIVLARVHTEGNRAIDSFYVRPVLDATRREQVRTALLEAIGA
jgi:[protein-PII] uridylyltransferase